MSAARTITIEIHDADVLAAFNRLQAANANMGPAWRAIGELLTESTKRRFETSSGPDGQRWPANSRATYEALARKTRGAFSKKSGKLSAKGAGTLIAKKLLIGESKALSTIIHYRADQDGVAIGSPMDYAAMMHFGGSKAIFPHLWGDIPARPFLGISADDKIEVLEILQDHLLGQKR